MDSSRGDFIGREGSAQIEDIGSDLSDADSTTQDEDEDGDTEVEGTGESGEEEEDRESVPSTDEEEDVSVCMFRVYMFYVYMLQYSKCCNNDMIYTHMHEALCMYDYVMGRALYAFVNSLYKDQLYLSNYYSTS